MRSFIVVLSLALAAFGQGAAIGAPTAGQTLVAGDNTTVIVERPDSLTGSSEIGIGITLHHCVQNPCEDATEDLGDILYNGAFNPQFQSTGPRTPYQNFSVAIPSGFPAGLAVLSVPHSSLVGAGPFVLNQIINVTVNIQG